MSSYLIESKRELCCGCRSCEQVCLKKCISMKVDLEGFLYPYIDRNNCNYCGQCQLACPIQDGAYSNSMALEHPDTYSLVHRDSEIREKSSSGGAFSAIVDAFCEKNCIIFGAGFDENLVVRHSYVTEIEELTKFRKSKYVQSDMGNCYREAQEFLNQGKEVLFSGTPCQIAGLKSFLNKDYDKLLCIDISCHGVPSPKLFEIYKNYLEIRYKSSMIAMDFREKGYHGSAISQITSVFANKKRYQSILFDDPYGIAFYKNLSLRPVCYECPFSGKKRVSDITIADFWGYEVLKPHLNDNKGISLVLVNTLKGQQVFEVVKGFADTESANLHEVLKFNHPLTFPAELNNNRDQFYHDLDKLSFDQIVKKYLKGRNPLRRLLSKLLNNEQKHKIKRLLKIG